MRGEERGSAPGSIRIPSAGIPAASVASGRRAHRGRRSRGLPGAVLCVAGLLAGCQEWTSSLVSESSPAPAAVLEGSELSLVSTRFSAPPKELYTRGDRFQVRVSFDQELVDLPHLAATSLWSQDRSGGPWSRIAGSVRGQDPRLIQFRPERDGAFGLRVSALQSDGSEVLAPAEATQPLIWIYVDRNPPKLTWLSPPPNSTVREGEALRLEWGASEMRFGDSPSVLEWSSDGGASWSVIERVKAVRGFSMLGWRVPPVPPGGSPRPLVRITAWDLVGNRASALLPLQIGGRAPPPASAPSNGPGNRPASGPTLPREELPAAASPVFASARGSGEPTDAATAAPPPPPPEAESQPPRRSGAPDRPAAATASAEGKSILLKNPPEGALPGGVFRYLFFEAGGFDPERTAVRIEWRASEDEPWSLVAAAIPAREGKFRWKVPEVTTTGGRLRLVATSATEPITEPITGPAAGAPSAPPRGGDEARPASGGGLAVESEIPIAVDSLPPIAEIRGVKRSTDGSSSVTLNCYDRGPAGLDRVELWVTRDDGATYEEIPVADPAKPVEVKALAGRLGFAVSAADRAGNATARPGAGKAPPVVSEAGSAAQLAVESFEEECLRGGAQQYLTWKYQGPVDQTARVETSLDGGSSWEPLGEVPASAGKFLWITPGENGAALLRLRVRMPDGSILEGRTRPVRIDAAPPQLEPGQIPARTSGALEFPLSVTDPGGSGVESVQAHTRPASDGHPGTEGTAPAGESRAWQARPAGSVDFQAEKGRIRIQVTDLPEGAHEILLTARDRAGNGGPPTPSSAPLARFVIDRTPVSIRAAPTAGPWVEGLTAAVQLEIDLADAVPPLWLEERAGEAWSEVLRWESLNPGEDLFRFPIPVGRSEYAVRFGVRDAVGNVSYAVVGPREIERAIRLQPTVEGAAAKDEGALLKSGANLSIGWKIHPALDEIRAELRVAVFHRPDPAADWILLKDNLSAGAAFVWTLPAGDESEHRLRLGLSHRGRPVGEETGPPFRIAAAPAPPARVDPQVVVIGEQSLYHSERGEMLLDRYRAARAQYLKWLQKITAELQRDAKGNLSPQEFAKLPLNLQRSAADQERNLKEMSERIQENFQRALEADPKNYRATYGLAQLLQRISPDQGDQVLTYLNRTVEIKSDHAPALNDLGAALILRGDYAASEEPLRRAVAIDPQGPYRYNLALALFHQEKTAEARGEFEAALARGGSAVRPGEVYYYLVSAFVKEGNLGEARSRFEKYSAQIPPALRESLKTALR